MNYFLMKLAFDTAVHFGASDTARSISSSEDHIVADTLFSALCHTALQLYGEEGLRRLCDWVRDGKLLLSDTMPWWEEEYFLPRPCGAVHSRKELSSGERKAMKKLVWIPVRGFSAFTEVIRGEGSLELSACPPVFGFEQKVTKAAVSDRKEVTPYQVGVYQFEKDCGLYLIVALEAEEQEETVKDLLRALGSSGIGGKISSGYGKFHLEDLILLNEPYDDQTEWLYTALTKKRGRSLLLSTSLPKEEELEEALAGADFQVVRRSGFVASDGYGDTPLKKKTQYFFRAGSTFSNRFTGDIYSVGGKGKHPVYRYGKALFLGVDL